MRRLFAATLLFAARLFAHVGSPDIFFEGQAGPYRLLVTVRPPQVVPGVAQIEIRSASPDVRQVRIVPLRIDGPGAQFAPAPDVAQPAKEDPQFYTGSLWLMTAGSWQVRVDVDGRRGPGRLAVPVPAVSLRTLSLQRALAAVLIPLGLILCAGIVSIVGASVREGQLEPGLQPNPARLRRTRTVMIATAAIVGGILYLGGRWWGAEAGWHERYIFKPIQAHASLEADSRLVLRLEDPGWLNRNVDDLIPDHNHLMHLYVMSIPRLERVWHLHPERTGSGVFEQALPGMPAGRYALYGDIVHANGLAETIVTEIDLPDVRGRNLAGDDSAGAGPPVGEADYNRSVSPLSEGYRMLWHRPAARLRARSPLFFRFAVEDAAGQPARGMELYMGMQGHAAFVRTDRSVFAHIHPSGTVPMAALALTQPGNPHAGHMMPQGALPAEISFPYGFPKSGNYRIFVQVKRAGRVETGIFDAQVEN